MNDDAERRTVLTKDIDEGAKADLAKTYLSDFLEELKQETILDWMESHPDDVEGRERCKIAVDVINEVIEKIINKRAIRDAAVDELNETQSGDTDV